MSVVSIQLEDIADYYGDLVPAFARLFAHKDFRTSEGIFVAKGSPDDNSGFYQEFTASLVGTKIRIATGTAYSTTDAIANPNVGYSLAVYDANGTEIKRVFSTVHIPPVSPTTWGAIEIFTKGKQQRYPSTYLDSNAIISLLSQYQGNVLAVDDAYGPGWNGNLAVAGKNAIYDALESLRSAKQDVLVPGTSIKTINGVSPLGSGDLVITGGVETFVSSVGTLGALLTTAGANPSVKYHAIVDALVPVTAANTIPANIYFEFKNGGMFVKSFTGALNFQGLGLVDPESTIPIFSGFSSGDVTFSGSWYPLRLSSELWDNASWSAKQNCAHRSVQGKYAVIISSPGALDAQVVVKNGHTHHLSGTGYTDTWISTRGVRFVMEDNSCLKGDGMYATHFQMSSTIQNQDFIMGSGLFTIGLDGPNKNIEVRDLMIEGDLATGFIDSGETAVHLGNCIGGLVENVYLKNVRAYGIFAGLFSSSGHHADGIVINKCVFDGVRGQNVGSTNGKNFIISNNLFKNIEPVATDGLFAVVDFEPNQADDLVRNIHFINNIIDGTGALVNWNGIVLQNGGGSNAGPTNCIVADNTIIGDNTSSNNLVNGIVIAGGWNCLVDNNSVWQSSSQGITISNGRETYVTNNKLTDCSGGGNPAIAIHGLLDGFVNNNIANGRAGGLSQANQITETAGLSVVNTSGTAVTFVSGDTFLPWLKGKIITIDGSSYTVNSVTDSTHLVLTTSAGVLTGKTLLTIPNNIYAQNKGEITLAANSQSKVKSALDRVVHDSVAVVQITGNRDDFTTAFNDSVAGLLAYQYILTSNGNYNITGMNLERSPYFYIVQDGQRHEFYNNSAFNLTLKHENASSTAIYRFHNTSGADIILGPGETVLLVYSKTLNRWIVSKPGDLPDNVYFKSGGENLIKYSSGSGAIFLAPTRSVWIANGNLIVDTNGKLNPTATMTAGGTTGAQTISKPAGSVNFAAGAGTAGLVVTNSLVSASSIILCVVMTNDATLKSAVAVPAPGSFTIFGNANATAETKVGFMVLN